MPKHGVWELSSETIHGKSWITAPPQTRNASKSMVSTPTLDMLLAEAAPFLHPLLKDVIIPTNLPTSRGTDVEPYDKNWRTTIKLQGSDGGGACFPMHFDTASGVDSRVVTAIYYLNEEWTVGDGGELSLFPFPYPPPLPLSPITDRLVLFSSRHMLHRVLPSHVPRCCLTFWLYDGVELNGKPGRPFKPLTSAPEISDPPLDECVSLSLLLHPKLRSHYARLVYADQWAASMRESHAPSPKLEVALERNAHEIFAIERRLADYLAGSGLKGRAADPLALAAAHIPVDEALFPGLVSWF